MTSETRTVVGIGGQGAVVGTVRKLHDVVEQLDATTRELRVAADLHAASMQKLTRVIMFLTFVIAGLTLLMVVQPFF